MLQKFEPGDVLILQLESGYALLRVLAVDGSESDAVWHVAAYGDFFPDVESAEAALSSLSGLTLSSPHIALTNRAFESTQVARIANIPLEQVDLEPLSAWRRNANGPISDRSVRLMMGLR